MHASRSTIHEVYNTFYTLIQPMDYWIISFQDRRCRKLSGVYLKYYSLGRLRQAKRDKGFRSHNFRSHTVFWWHLPRPDTFVKYFWFFKDDSVCGLHWPAATEKVESFSNSKFKIIVSTISCWKPAINVFQRRNNVRSRNICTDLHNNIAL